MKTRNFLQQLDVFVLAVDHKSFSAASRKLGHAQSYISNTISSLEDTLGFALFEREGQYPTLTKEGNWVYSQAVSIVSQKDHILNNATKALKMQEISIMVEECLTHSFLIDSLSNCLPKQKDVTLNLKSGHSSEVVDLVSNSSVDVGIVSCFDSYDSRIVSIPLPCVPLGFYASSFHALSNENDITIEALRSHRQLLLDASNDMSSQMYNISNDIWRTDSLMSIATLIGMGFGWGILPVSFADSFVSNKKIVKLKSPIGLVSNYNNCSLILSQTTQNRPIIKGILDQFIKNVTNHVR